MIQFDRNDGWKIDAKQRLIRHSCGFEAEFKGCEIYGIKHFPIEATIRDIRNMVVKAEEILAEAKKKT
ncbi:MAG: hypothetical protein AB2728_10375 [Candidatus Thiodiazotropha sp.]|nr:hypothetical protein [Candidatus Thiodiazotropha taylori]MBT3062961.1 hypothetical protein [Candidatus Thiodiazotropha sp. (ex Lucina pensylvanica)]PUB75083.1 MAG: hypothetical protein DBP03_07425 [gamma proteobacterium symbiont of Ctena orbiculata]PUB80250.1 MAG: hypothetical protein DBO99_01675 [gamma proteobacterium symbiont of Ctena orbiculata]